MASCCETSRAGTAQCRSALLSIIATASLSSVPGPSMIKWAVQRVPAACLSQQCALPPAHAHTRPAVAKEIAGAHGRGSFKQIECGGQAGGVACVGERAVTEMSAPGTGSVPLSDQRTLAPREWPADERAALPAAATVSRRHGTICRVGQASSSRDLSIRHRRRTDSPAALALRVGVTATETCCR